MVKLTHLIPLLLSLSAHAQPADPPVTMSRLDSDIVVAEDGGVVQMLHMEVKLGNDAAARQAAQQTLGFSEGLETIELVEAYTQKPDGRRIAVQPSAVRTQLAPGVAGMPAFNDHMTVTAVMPDVAGGDTIAVTWRRTVHHPLIAGQFAAANLFFRTMPWQDVRMTIITPADKPLLVEAHGPDVAQEEADGRHVTRIHYAAAAVPSDPAVLLPLDRAPRVFTSTYPDWAAFSRAYAAVFAPHAAPSPRIEFQAEHAAMGAEGRREEARLIAQWIGHHIRWAAVTLGTGSIVPHDADEVLTNGYGDCKDQVALLVAMLRTRGIEAVPVLIHAGITYTLSGPPTYAAFNHMIAYLPEWDLYVDTTPGDAPFGVVAVAEHGKPILRITEQGEAPGRLPPLAPGEATERLRTVATLGEDGVVTGTSTTDTSGSFAVALRGAARAVRAQGAERMAELQLHSVGQPGTGAFTVAAQADPLSADERLDGRFTLEAHPGWLEGDTFTLPTGLRTMARPGDGPIGPMNPSNLPATEPTPCFAARQEEELSLTLPSGRRPERLPAGTSLDGSFFHYVSTWSFTDNTVTVRRTMVSTADEPLCTGSRRAEAARALAAIRRDIEARIALVKAD